VVPWTALDFAVLASLSLVPASGQNEVRLHFRLEQRTAASPAVQKLYTASQIALLEKLNRADSLHLNRLKFLVAPDRWDLDELAYSPLPQRYDSGGHNGKCLVIYLPGQIFGAYEYGRLVRWGPVSSGRRQRPTPPGLFHLNWKSEGRHSTVDPQWYMRWYFNFNNREGRALHAYAMPGYPASHACIRLLERDAVWLFGWGDSWRLAPDGMRVTEPGTPVFIVGEYEFGALPPWRSIAWWSKAVGLPSLPASNADAAHVAPASALILQE
jgi:hypothetical protein